MTRRDISLFGRAFTALSIIVRVAEELPAPKTIRHAEFRIGQCTEAIRDVLHRMDRIALENGVYYAGANICKTYTEPFETYMLEARKALEEFIVNCQEYDEATRYFVNSLTQRTFALRKIFA